LRDTRGWSAARGRPGRRIGGGVVVSPSLMRPRAYPPGPRPRRKKQGETGPTRPPTNHPGPLTLSLPRHAKATSPRLPRARGLATRRTTGARRFHRLRCRTSPPPVAPRATWASRTHLPCFVRTPARVTPVSPPFIPRRPRRAGCDPALGTGISRTCVRGSHYGWKSYLRPRTMPMNSPDQRPLAPPALASQVAFARPQRQEWPT
jgi:hypothetical protein